MELVFIYGPAAVGKLTIGRELAKLTGFRLFHNHLVVDAVMAMFDFGSASFIKLREQISMLTFSTYPGTLFEGAIKIVLFSLIPAGFVTYLPIEALRSLSWTHAACTIVGSLTVLGVGISVFYHGLRRYESGNLMEMRG